MMMIRSRGVMMNNANITINHLTDAQESAILATGKPLFVPFLLGRGFYFEMPADGSRFMVKPVSKLTEKHKAAISKNLPAILAELKLIASTPETPQAASPVEVAAPQAHWKPVDLEALCATADPRPDIAKDHGLWELALRALREENPILHGLLLGFRAWGARIAKSAKGGKLLIDYTVGEGWESRSDFGQDYEYWLRPFQDGIEALLRRAQAPEGFA